jgi:Fe-S-cluster containining protein
MTRLSQNKFFADGLKFQCQGSGKCCVSRGQYGFVYMTLQDRREMASVLGLTTAAFTRQYCEKTDGVWHLRSSDQGPDCLFLNEKKQCEVYEGRPTQCRTWPFWPENLSPRAWNKNVTKFCPGVGKGSMVSAKVIATQVAEQKRSDRELFR